MFQKDLSCLEKKQRAGVAKSLGQQPEKSMQQKLPFPRGQERFLTSISTLALSVSLGAFTDPLSRRSAHCIDMPGLVLSLAFFLKMAN